MTTKVFVKIQVLDRKLSLRQEQGSFHIDAVFTDEMDLVQPDKDRKFVEESLIPVLCERLKVLFSLDAIWAKQYTPGFIYDLAPTSAVQLDPYQFFGLEPQVLLSSRLDL